jgi:hypothetical protein
MKQLTLGQNKQYWYVSGPSTRRVVSPTTAAWIALHSVFAINTCSYERYKVKVKVTLEQSTKPRPGRFTSGKDPVPIVPVWMGADNLAFTGIRSPDRSARSESIYRPRYSGPFSKSSAVYYTGTCFGLYHKPSLGICTALTERMPTHNTIFLIRGWYLTLSIVLGEPKQ